MKYFFLIASLLASLIPSVSVQAAATDTQIIVKSLTQPLVYGSDFNVVAMDFTMETEVGEVLDAITFTSSGTARSGVEVVKLVLWADIGDEGFQGWGYDQRLGETTLTTSWVFKDLNYEFKESSQRFFVSLESGPFIQDKTFQIVISQPVDAGSDGVFQTNDRGVFFLSGAVPTIPVTPSTTVFFKNTKLDQQPPRAFINDLEYTEANTIVNPDTLPILITGQARDKGLGMVDEVKVVFPDQELYATNTGNGFSSWSVEYTPSEPVIDGTIHVVPMDDEGRNWIGPKYDFYVDTRAIDPVRTMLDLSVIDASLNIGVTIFDGEASPLPYRNLSIVLVENGVALPPIQGETGDDGAIIAARSINLSASYEVKVLYKGLEIASQMVDLPDESTPEEPPMNNEGIQPGDLIKASLDAVYYYSAQGTRHVFVTQSIYDTWYDDFSSIKVISDTELAAIPLGAAVGYRPGTMLTAPSINEVYVIDRGQVLRHLGSEQVALDLYGPTWNKQINDLQESLLFNYNFGTVIQVSTDIDLPTILQTSITIDDELALS